MREDRTNTKARPSPPPSFLHVGEPTYMHMLLFPAGCTVGKMLVKACGGPWHTLLTPASPFPIFEDFSLLYNFINLYVGAGMEESLKRKDKLPPSAKNYKCCLSFAPASLSFLLPSTLFFGSYLSFFVPLRDRSSLHCSAGTSESKLTGSRERRCVKVCVSAGVFVSGWGSHASSELIPVISTIMRCTRRSLPACPPASVTNCHHPGGQTRTLSRTLTHWWDSSPSPHTCSCRHTDSYSPGKERRKEGRIRRISHLLLRPLYVVLILGAEQKKQAHHSCARTHLYPRSHGLLD